MQTRTRGAARQRFALVAFTSLWLGACGGGGGGGDATPTVATLDPGTSTSAAGTAPSASPSGSTAPAPSPTAPTPAPAAVSVFQSGDLWLTTSHAGEVQRYQGMQARLDDGSYVQQFQRIARLTDGTYVAVRDNWVMGQDFSDARVLMRKLDADGNPVGAETAVGTGTSPAITAFADGTFLVTWLAPPPLTFSFFRDVNGQRYDATGSPVGTPMPLGAAPGYAQPVALADGSFVVAVAGQQSHVNGPMGAVRGYARDGSPTGFHAELQEDSCGVASAPSVAALPAGGFAVAWGYVCVSAPQVRMRVYDATGALAASSRMTVGVQGQGLFNPGLATLTSGHVALAWGLVDQAGIRELRTQVVDPTALPDSPAGAEPVAMQGGRTPGLVQSLAGGGFLIPWSAASDGEAQVPVSRYSNAGEPL